jgi:hypothetical protein
VSPLPPRLASLESVRYLAAAERTGDWLISTAERGPDGWCWPVEPGVSDEVGPGVGWGTAAPTLFFTEAFRTTGDERWRAAARQGVRWMDSRLEVMAGEWAGCGLFTGVGGWAVVLDELADAADDDEARELAGRVLAVVAARASGGGGRVHWHDLTEILWGTAGIGCLMLTLGQRYLGPRAVELAVGAGDWLLGQAEQTPTGICGRWVPATKRHGLTISAGSRTSRTERPGSGSSWPGWLRRPARRASCWAASPPLNGS